MAVSLPYVSSSASRWCPRLTSPPWPYGGVLAVHLLLGITAVEWTEVGTGRKEGEKGREGRKDGGKLRRMKDGGINRRRKKAEEGGRNKGRKDQQRKEGLRRVEED